MLTLLNVYRQSEWFYLQMATTWDNRIKFLVRYMWDLAISISVCAVWLFCIYLFSLVCFGHLTNFLFSLYILFHIPIEWYLSFDQFGYFNPHLSENLEEVNLEIIHVFHQFNRKWGEGWHLNVCTYCNGVFNQSDNKEKEFAITCV